VALIVIVAKRAPVICGVNTTLTVQLLFVPVVPVVKGVVDAQVPPGIVENEDAEAPVNATVMPSRVMPELELFTVTVWNVLVTKTGTTPKLFNVMGVTIGGL
jgi:hypothetical protein